MQAVARKGLGPWAAASDPDLQGTSRRKKKCPEPGGEVVCENLLLL